jgi:hypothetical protein
MRVRSVATLYLVFAILFVVAVATEIFVQDTVRPAGLFGYLAISTLISGAITTAITERLDAHILQ